jgi:hypothetical protein
VLVGPGAQEDEDDVFEPLDMNRTCRDQITMARLTAIYFISFSAFCRDSSVRCFFHSKIF